MRTRSERRRTSLADWQRFLPILDASLAANWDDVVREIHQSGFSRNDFIAFTAQHDLAWTFNSLIEHSDTSAKLPSWLLIQLLATTKWGVLRKRELLVALNEFTHAAEVAELDFLLLKGFHVANRFYDDPQARWFRDLDVLVQVGDQARATRLLTDLSFQSEQVVRLPEWVQNQLAHAQSWQKGDLAIDLHHQYRAWPDGDVDTALIFAHSRKQTVGGLTLSVPADEDSLLMLLMSLVGDIAQARVSARNLVDFWAMLTHLDHRVDWDWFFNEKLDERNVHLVVQSALLIMACLPQSVRFPGLQESLQKLCPDSKPTRQEALGLFSAPQFSLPNRFWFLRHYNGNTLVYLNWWLVGGLFRSGSVVALLRALLPEPSQDQ